MKPASLLRLTAQSAGTRIEMSETPIAGPGKWLHNRATDALLTRRNVESLARLAAITERRTTLVEQLTDGVE